jgi:shikimate kinase
VTRHLVLLGLMGSGKTSIGARVAEQLGWRLLDGDEQLATQTGGRTAAEIEAEAGIEVLHQLEADIALAALAAATPTVIGPAASVVESLAVRGALAGHRVVWLRASAELLAESAAAKSHRPLLHRGDTVALFARQLAVREPLVLPLAGLVIDVAAVTVERAADAIVAFVCQDQSARR